MSCYPLSLKVRIETKTKTKTKRKRKTKTKTKARFVEPRMLSEPCTASAPFAMRASVFVQKLLDGAQTCAENTANTEKPESVRLICGGNDIYIEIAIVIP
jgi:hypothetical protein